MPGDAASEKLTFRRIWIKEPLEQFYARIAEDAERGANWVRNEALSGFAEAQVGFGHMLLDGYGVARDAEAAARWFRLAALQDNADGCNMLGRCYERGWGVAVDPRQALHWYELAAAKGHDWAQFNLAALMLQTQGERADLSRARSLLVASARKGNAKAKNMLGRWREQGWDGRAKQRSASLWFRWAAEAGCYRGQFHHARLLLSDGKVNEAVRWLRSSLHQAPPDFARDAGAMLIRHESERVRRIGEEFLAAAGRAGQRAAPAEA